MKKLFATIVLSAVTSMVLANPVTVKGDEGTYTVPMSMAGTNAPVHWDEGHAIFCDAYPPQPGRHGSLPLWTVRQVYHTLTCCCSHVVHVPQVSGTATVSSMVKSTQKKLCTRQRTS